MHHTVTDAFNEIIGYVFSIIYHCILMCLLQKLFWAVKVLNGAQGLTEDTNLSRKLVLLDIDYFIVVSAVCRRAIIVWGHQIPNV